MEIIISTHKQHGDLKQFLLAFQVDISKAIAIPTSWENHSEIGLHLKQFANIELPHSAQWRAGFLFQDEWDERRVAIDVADKLIWYQWTTSA
ncbi:hypothetical protein [Undibacterium sp. YM2]|uniref:hypothetical protein n=1 Tax=Undibacterium sp. YM2 TaxID=2058625 RepID=UPI00138A2F29|nr:hypothetical protein [Undibacterium sp. YM2]